MRLHVNCFYALMLLLSYNVSIKITCSGKLQKRAIDFDEIADFADIIEPEPSSLQHSVGIQNSLMNIRNLDLELPKEVTQTQSTTTLDHRRSPTQAQQNEVASTNETPMIANYANDVNKILSFRMKQHKRLLRSKRQASKHKLQKRYVNLPVVASRGGSYLSHLADATNDINLKMQNYAATMMVVLTTPRSTTNLPYGSKVTGKLVEIKTVQPNEKGDDSSSVSESTRAAYENLLQTFTTFNVAHNKAMTTPISKLQVTKSAGERNTNKLRTTVSENPFLSTALSTSKHTSGTSTQRGSPVDSSTHNSDDEYPLLGADGFYSEIVEGNSLPLDRRKRNKWQTKIGTRLKRETINNCELNKLGELGKVSPVAFKVDRSHKLDIESSNKAKQSTTVVPLTNMQHSTQSSTNPSRTTREQVTTAGTSATSLAATATTATATAATTPQGTRECPTKSSQHTSTHLPRVSGTTTPYNTNPYRWENDIIKELNVKFKKEAAAGLKAPTFITPLVFVSKILPATVQIQSLTTDAINDAVKQNVVREDNKSTSSALNGGNLTVSVPIDGGKAVNVPICKGKECYKMNQTFLVYNDTAGDCNKEADEEGGVGGYTIMSNEDTPPTTNHACPIHFTTTEASTTPKPDICDKQPSSPCEPGDDDDIEPCDMNMSDAKQATCKKQKNKKTHNQRKLQKAKDKRQIAYTPSMPNYQTPPNFGIQQQPSFLPNTDIQRALNSFASTQFTPSNPTQYFANSAKLVSATFNPMSSTALPLSQAERVFKKSVDKSVISSVIENLKVVDQKLADAVDPLHSAQEQLDAASRCDTTLSPCSDVGHGNDGGLLNELSESEKIALQRLAIKIMANQNTKLKRADGMPVMPVDQDPRDLTKRGIVDYDYADEDRLSRLQRDLSIAQRIETFVEQIKKRQDERVKRELIKSGTNYVSGRKNGKTFDDFGEREFGHFQYGNGDTKFSRSLGVINTRVKDNDDIVEEYQTPKKKTKPKKLWRKLFGLTNNRSHNRFLDQDIPNSQSIRESVKR